MTPTLIVINGPTAVGKTKLAIELALHLNTEIVSTDSRQFYKELNIGTAKPSKEELAMVRHHFINNRTIDQYYSAGDFEREALSKITELFDQGKNCVIAIGGSGLYIKALTEGLDEMPEADIKLRNELVLNFKNHGLIWLQDELKKLDPVKNESIDTNNPQRLMRAIELIHQGGLKKKETKVRPFGILKIGLELPRHELYERINQRVLTMMKEGLLKEVEMLLPKKNLNALQTVGYSELFEYLEGKTDLGKAIELIQQHTRNYAKRQITWFKADQDIHWFNANEKDKIMNWLDDQLRN